jgi:hypothetical protein
MPAEDLDPAIELFRHRFLHALREAKLISPGKLADLLSWQHSGFHIHDGGEKPVAAHDSAGRKRLAEYLLRHPFSLQKITWNASTQTVIKGGALPPGAHAKGTRKPSPSTGRQSILGIQLSPSFGMRPTARPRYQHKTRGQTPLIPDRIIRLPKPEPLPEKPPPAQILLIPAPPKQSARDMRPLWRDLILQIWPALRSLPDLHSLGDGGGEGWGRRSAPVPLLQGHHETRPQSHPPRGNSILPPSPWALGGNRHTPAPAASAL